MINNFYPKKLNIASMQGLLSLLLLLIPLGSWLGRVSEIYQKSFAHFQQDALVYYKAALALGIHQNPYLTESFVYPPLTLLIWKIVVKVLSVTAYYEWYIFLKGSCAIFLVWLWRRYFVPHGVFFYIFVLLAFGRTMDADLWSGNISTFEATFLFLGFIAFVKNKNYLFALFVLLASLFKITPILFLGLLLYPYDPQKIKLFFLSGLLFLGYLTLNWVVYPEYTIDFFSQAFERRYESSVSAPSLYSFIHSTYEYFSIKIPLLYKYVKWELFYYFSVAFIVIVSAKAICVYQKNKGIKKSIEIVLFYITVYLLILPRVKDYMFILAIPSAYYFIHKTIKRRPNLFWLVLFLPLVALHGRNMPLLFFVYQASVSYFSFLLLFVTWIFGIYALSSRRSIEISERV